GATRAFLPLPQVDGGTPPPAVGAVAGGRLGGPAGQLVPVRLVVGPQSGLVRRLVRPPRRRFPGPPPRRVDPPAAGAMLPPPAPATGDTSRSPAARRGSGAARRRGASRGSPARPAR